MENDDFRISPAAIRALAEGDIENFFVAATPGGIEAQEARGQRAFVAEFRVIQSAHPDGVRRGG